MYKFGVFLFGIKLLSEIFKMYDVINASNATHRKYCAETKR